MGQLSLGHLAVEKGRILNYGLNEDFSEGLAIFRCDEGLETSLSEELFINSSLYPMRISPFVDGVKQGVILGQRLKTTHPEIEQFYRDNFLFSQIGRMVNLQWG